LLSHIPDKEMSREGELDMREKLWAGFVLATLFFLLVLPTSVSVGTAEFDNFSGSFIEQSSIDWWPMFRHDLNHTGHSTSTAPGANSTIWDYTTGWYVFSSPAVADGKVFVGSQDCKVYALNVSNGEEVWNYTTNGAVYSSPAVVDGKVFVGSRDWNVYGLNASTGARMWNFTTGLEVWSSPAVADGKVFIGSHDRNVYGLNASTGACIWKYRTGWYVFSSPSVADGMVFVGSHDYRVYAFGGVHDLAITGVEPSKTVVGQGYTITLAINATNQGSCTETFNITAYANTTVILTETITLSSGNYATITLTWNTTGFAYGNYTIKAYATPVPGETDTTDNTYINGIVLVTIPGDVDNSGEINILDVSLVCHALWTTPASDGTPGDWWAWNPACDLNNDGKIDGADLAIVTLNYGKTT